MLSKKKKKKKIPTVIITYIKQSILLCHDGTCIDNLKVTKLQRRCTWPHHTIIAASSALFGHVSIFALHYVSHILAWLMFFFFYITILVLIIFPHASKLTVIERNWTDNQIIHGKVLAISIHLLLDEKKMIIIMSIHLLVFIIVALGSDE